MQRESGVPVFESRLKPFIKYSAFRYDYVLGNWVIEPPAFDTLRITQEDAFLHVRAKGTATFVPLHMDISQRAKDAQVGYIRLVTKPGLEGSYARYSRAGSAIKHIHQCAQGLPPECRW